MCIVTSYHSIHVFLHFNDKPVLDKLSYSDYVSLFSFALLDRVLIFFIYLSFAESKAMEFLYKCY